MEPNGQPAPQNACTGSELQLSTLSLAWGGGLKVSIQENVCKIISQQKSISCLFKRWR